MAGNDKPPTWAEWKTQHYWPRLTSFEWMLKWLMYWCQGSATFWFLEVAGWIATVAAVVVGVATWLWEADGRVKQSHYRAWELINSARDSRGDGGRRNALQDLNEDGVDLSAAPLANAYLREVQIPKATLVLATLTGADLRRANLIGANLAGANLFEANLRDANLAGVNNLWGAKFCKTTMPDGTLNNRDCPPESPPPDLSETPPAPN